MKIHQRHKRNIIRMGKKNDKKVVDYIIRLVTLIEQIKNYGDVMKNEVMMGRGVIIFETIRYYVDECWSGEGKKSQNFEEEEEERSDSNFEPMMLMITTTKDIMVHMNSYIQIGCLNHMIGNNKLIDKFDSCKIIKVKMDGNDPMEVEGMWNILVHLQDDKNEVREKVIYVPGSKWNLMNFGQLVEKGHSIIMEYDSLKLYDDELEINIGKIEHSIS